MSIPELITPFHSTWPSRGDTAESVILVGFSVPVNAVFDAD
jgi:hypothetical protein